MMHDDNQGRRASLASERYTSEHWEDRVRLSPPSENLSQTDEWCEIETDGTWRRLRFHDYHEVYQHPGLYEHLFYGVLRCDSPRRVIGLMEETARELELPMAEQRVLDLGAGNGIVGHHLRDCGAGHVLGIDIIPEAEVAAKRDRPTVYDGYVVDDLTYPSADTMVQLHRFRPTSLVCVAALGFGDIPPRAYYNTANLVPNGGLLAFNIKEDFLDARYTHGFSELVRRMLEDKVARVESTRRYRHRLSTTGESIYYVAMVLTKLAPISEGMLVESAN